MNGHKFLYAVVSVSFLFTSVCVCAERDMQLNYATDANRLMVEISKRGASSIVKETYSNPSVWDALLANIATGNPAWLKAAVALHPGSDAGASEMLTLSVGEALGNAPENVFRIALNEFQLEFICSGPDVDDVRFDSYALSMEEMNKRQKNISGITNSDLRDAAIKCYEALEKSKDGIARFYQVKEN